MQSHQKFDLLLKLLIFYDMNFFSYLSVLKDEHNAV